MTDIEIGIGFENQIHAFEEERCVIENAALELSIRFLRVRLARRHYLNVQRES